MIRTLLVGNYEVELDEVSVTSVTKSVYDIQEFSQTKTNFTKTIRIPSTRVNNQIFISYFDISMTIESDSQFNPFFNPSKKVYSAYYEDSLLIIEGYMKLNNITQINGFIYYEVNIVGENGDLFKILEGRKMSDLDLSKYDHEYNQTNIIDSWGGYNIVNGVRTFTGFGTGYVYPIVNNGSFTTLPSLIGGTTFPPYINVTNIDVWFYVKGLIDEIFAAANKKYYSSFMSLPVFEYLVVKGFGNARRTETEIQNSLIVLEKSSQALTILSQTGFNLYNNPFIFNVETSDPNNEYNTTNGNLTILETKDYDIYFECQAQFTSDPLGATPPIQSDVTIDVFLIDDLGNTIIFNRTTMTVFNQLSFTAQVNVQRQNLTLSSARTYRWSITYTASWSVSGLIPVTNINCTLADCKLEMFLNGSVDANETYDINNLLTPDMTQKDFLMGILKMFRMYIEPYHYEPTESGSGAYNTYIIEPRDNYYVDRVVDWSDKLDKDKEIVIEPIGLAKEKFLKYTYEEDNDYHNDLYKKMTNRVYGDYTAAIDNDFLTGTQEIKIPFSQMIVATRTDATNQFIFPIATDVKEDKTGRRSENKKMKIAFFQGSMLVPPYLLGDDVLGNNATTQNFIGAISNYDSYGNPEYDLNFDTPEYLFYTLENGDVIKGNIGLFNRFHKKEIEEINNKNSKVLIAYFNLKSVDVHNISFRPLYFIDGHYYRLYEVTDYNGSGTTKCTFLKLTPALPFEKSVIKTKGGLGGGAQIYTDTINLDGRNFGHELIRGANNNVGGVNQVPLGNNNVVSLAFSTLSLVNGTHKLTGSEGSPLYISVDTTLGNATINLPQTAQNLGKVYNITKISALNQVIVKDYNDVLIDTITGAQTNTYIIQ